MRGGRTKCGAHIYLASEGAEAEGVEQGAGADAAAVGGAAGKGS